VASQRRAGELLYRTIANQLQDRINDGEWPLLMSAATLIAAPAVIAFLLIEKHLTDTMAMSGIKG
jgi:ABC-type glycerol-3-phosphate transport system permease component